VVGNWATLLMSHDNNEPMVIVVGAIQLRIHHGKIVIFMSRKTKR